MRGCITRKLQTMTHQEGADSTIRDAPSTLDDPPERASAYGPEGRDGDDPHVLPYTGELLRKALHLLALVIPAGMYLLGRTWSIAILVPFALVAVSADVLRARSRVFAGCIRSVFGPMMRPDELPPETGRIVVNGATWVLLAAAVLSILFSIEAAVPAFVSFMVADAAAALTGIRFGRRRWPGSSRTVEGSSAFVLVAFLALLLFDHVPIGAALTAAFVGAAAEVPSWRINDNVRVPVIIAIILVLWGV